VHGYGLLLHDLGLYHVLAELDEAGLELPQLLHEELLQARDLLLLLLDPLVYPPHLAVQLLLLGGDQLRHLVLQDRSEVPGDVCLQAMVGPAQAARVTGRLPDVLRLLVEKVLAELPDVDIADLALEGLQGILVVTEKPLAVHSVVLMRLELCREVLVG